MEADRPEAMEPKTEAVKRAMKDRFDRVSQVIGGILDVDSADKAARFMQICDAFGIPLVFLQDVPGFMIGSKVEHAGIIRHGAKIVLVAQLQTQLQHQRRLARAHRPAHPHHKGALSEFALLGLRAVSKLAGVGEVLVCVPVPVTVGVRVVSARPAMFMGV
jgi:hypothetical protein